MPSPGLTSPLPAVRSERNLRRSGPRFGLVLMLGLALIGSVSDRAAAARKVEPRSHVVYPGQTLGMIAKRYNVTLEALRAANQLRIGERIKPRQRLVIPGPDDPDGTKALEALRAAKEPARSAPRAKPAKAAAASEKPSGRRPAAANIKVEPSGRRPAAANTKKDTEQARGYARKPRHPGYVSLVSFTGGFKGQVLGKNGKLTPASAKVMARVLASWRTGERAQIDEKLIRLVVKVSDHFGGRTLRIVSGYRPFSPQQYTSHSRHNTGHAVDFSVDGVPNQVLRDYCRTLGKVGVGYYPHSSFVHLDVREAATYWVDYSGPGEAPRYATGDGRDPATIPASHWVPAESPFMSPERE